MQPLEITDTKPPKPMVLPNQVITKGVVLRLLQKIEADGSKAGLQAQAIQQLQQDCLKVLLPDQPFTI